jgi:hypothetical protein
MSFLRSDEKSPEDLATRPAGVPLDEGARIILENADFV